VAAAAAGAEGAARKAARRGLNVLKSRGVATPEQRRVGTIAATEAEIFEGWMMAPDPTVTQLFALTARAGTGRMRTCFVVLHPQRGVARVDNAALSKTQLHDSFDRALPNAGFDPVQVPIAWARHRVADARRAAKARGVPEPLGFSSAASLLYPLPESAPPHPLDEEGLELTAEDAKELAKGSASLHLVPEFRGWLPSNAAVQQLLYELGQKLGPSPEGREPDAVRKHLAEEVAAATDRFFSPELREELLGRMKDAALSVLSRDEQQALLVVATMKAVASAGLVTDPPRDIPFLRGFFDKAVGMLIAQNGGRLKIPVPTAAAAANGEAPGGEEPGASSSEPSEAAEAR
jgi:hypothetical protein